MENNNKWMFPIRMENSKQIETVDNIIEALAKFKAPITLATWTTVLRRGALRAQDPTHQPLLEKWWTEGWQYTPTLEHKQGVGTPILRIGEQVLGDTLEMVYPNLQTAAKELGLEPYRVKDIAQGVSPNTLFAGRLHLLRRLAEKELPQPQWTIFAADNTIQRQYFTLEEMSLGERISKRTLERAHQLNWNRLRDGRWIWYDGWGFIPISPDDEPLEPNWRTVRQSKTDT